MDRCTLAGFLTILLAFDPNSPTGFFRQDFSAMIFLLPSLVTWLSTAGTITCSWWSAASAPVLFLKRTLQTGVTQFMRVVQDRWIRTMPPLRSALWLMAAVIPVGISETERSVSKLIFLIQPAESSAILLLSCSCCCGAFGFFACFLILFAGIYLSFPIWGFLLRVVVFATGFFKSCGIMAVQIVSILSWRWNIYELDKHQSYEWQLASLVLLSYATISIRRFQGGRNIWTENFESTLKVYQ